jgi:hypothetical protein
MSEMMHCLPEGARRHFINLRNIRLTAETSKHRQRLANLRAELAAKGQHGRSGWQEMEEWKYAEELSDNLATGYVDDALATCRLYDIKITKPLCDCLLTAVEALLVIQYRNALKAQTKRHLFQPHISIHQHRMMPAIRVTVETARIQDAKERAEKMKAKQSTGNTYNQTITQHGGVMNASQTGDVSAQQITVQELSDIGSALAVVRSHLKVQDDSVDTAEHLGLLASAEKAAAEKNESKMLGYMKQIPAKLWDVAKPVATQALLAYLHLHGLLPGS